MKIQDFVLELHSESHKSSKHTLTTFEYELDSQNTMRTEESQAVKKELEFYKRLKYELLEQLICKLTGRDYTFKEVRYDTFFRREVSIKEEYEESQRLLLNMGGTVYTSDKMININIEVFVSHSFVSDHEILRQQFYDPLVVNFDGELPDLEGETFSFDIDMDSKKDELPLLKQGNAFLALDKNKDSKINDGGELFGAINGDGFTDLRRYDKDHNGWIDENDDIFDSLLVWIKTKEQDRIESISKAGIGAIYLGSTKSRFDIKEGAQTLGRIKESGFFLNEDGSSGILSQIDFARKNTSVLQEQNTPYLRRALKI